MSLLKGQFLIASPHLGDTNFYRSVVLMIQHDDQGALGLVMNRPTDRTVAEMWKLVDDSPCDSVEHVFLGGPVAGPLLAVHTDPTCAESTILEGVYFASSQSSLAQLVGTYQGSFRLFLGYSGWAAGQLEGELKAGGWLTLPATCDDIFSDHELLWNRVSRRVGLDILAPTIKRRGVPDDPSVN
jgi:putative transcriptional regulator